ncbi:patatin-like phospholipase family protein [Roseivirga sp. E12]|uniref:patatin-like phospholipase family protein n=1 Tax=Roseivirga sp. E12 TaxID=2819237 RepID=UPI001ABBEB0E|nr:patatin-like phospholipase family protein [Roseivirga sp. E12]MBO3698624.1 patatin-like phospholipase family protein [Roseivirga sp. E12]
MKIINAFVNSFPIKLLLVHVKHNQFLLFYWLILFSIVDGRFGKALGIPFLFLDPIYMGEVGFWGFLIIGVALAGFSMAFNITSYILDGFRFPFLGTLPRPFSHYCLNNSLIPIAFLTFYVQRVIVFQDTVELYSGPQIVMGLLGLFTGIIFMLSFLFVYFSRTNRDIQKVMRSKTLRSSKGSQRVRHNAFKQLRKMRRSKVKVKYYFSLKLKHYSTRRYEKYYDRIAILGIFKQNQRNAIVIELLLLAVLVILGVFQSSPLFQIPAAASGIFLFTMIVMATGALSYWLRSWVVTAVIGLLLLFNVLSSAFNWGYQYPAYGLDYTGEKADYSLETIEAISGSEEIEASKAHWLKMLENWRLKSGEEKPRMTLIAVSGGGQRSALWTINVLQHVDSVMAGNLMNETVLISGASGGLVGAAFYRDLFWTDKNPQDKVHLEHMGKELLNPLIFSLLINDIFYKARKFKYGGQRYKRERGYEFENNLSENLEGMLDRPISAYQKAEFSGDIPALLVSPLITNDGRKLYISPQPVSFLNLRPNEQSIVQGVDFRSLLKDQQADSLRFLTALRMSATFPYITPTITLPTNPPIKIADAGISDNYGVVDALIFLNVFKDWILENTSEVVLLSIRDSEKNEELGPVGGENFLERFFSPIQSAYSSWDKVQTIKNDQFFELTKSRMGDHLKRVEFQYVSEEGLEERASLSWRLTELEKRNILKAIHKKKNQNILRSLSGAKRY